MIPGINKRLLISGAAVLAVLAAAALAAGCSSAKNGAAPGQISVVATTVQMGALTQAVAGGEVHVTTLIKAGVDPHEFEPGPSDVRAISDAKLVIRNGLGLDDWLNRIINSSGGGQKVVTATTGVPVRMVDGKPDPHVWQNPENDKIIVANIAKALASADPAHATTYESNAKAYEAKLDQTDREVRALIDSIPPDQRKMVTDHDAFGYFIQRYGLTYVGAVIPSTTTDADASAQQVAQLEDLIRKEHVKAIFSESTANPKIAKQIAADTGAKIVDTLYGDSLGPPGSSASTVDGMILWNAQQITKALK